MTKSYEDVSFMTVDGIRLSGFLYSASRRGPAVILTPGFNCIKEDFYQGFCECFQKAGISALIYDPRNTGTSGGFPRNDIDPIRQVEDYSDAFIYLTTLPIVDPSAIVFWGVSFTGATVVAAAAIDKRIAAVICVAPILQYSYLSDDYQDTAISKMFRDRESQILHGNPPFFVSTTESRGLVPANSHIDVNPREGEAPLTHNRGGTTIQSFYRSLLWQPVPLGVMHRIDPTPVMFMTPENDTISPTQNQIDLFATLKGPKRFHLALGRGHVNVLMGDDMAMLAKVQTDFIWQVVKGRFKKSIGTMKNGAKVAAAKEVSEAVDVL
ncbi:DltD domain-containing protein [Phlyctema vagabunda]|uniref:DltD domain-containing protein n=1 Tax=Phlyctema vagabunda TaxID=108571 RepID=A0ABR4P2B0_9HELO